MPPLVAWLLGLRRVGGEDSISTGSSCLPFEKYSPPVITGPIGKLLPLAHAQIGHCPCGTLAVHVLHVAVGHLALRHEGLAASRHCSI